MLRFAPWKVVSIAGAIGLAGLAVMPRPRGSEIGATVGSHLPPWAHPRGATIAFDLRGGLRVVLEVDRDDLRYTMARTLRDDVRRILSEENVTTTGDIGNPSGGQGIQLSIPDAGARAKVMPKLRQLAAPKVSIFGGWRPPPYQVNEDGTGTIRIDVTDAGVTDKLRRAVERSIAVIRRRVDALGATKPLIEREGDDRILVEVPGLDDPKTLRDILTTPGKLTFRRVAETGEDSPDVDMLDDAEQPGDKLPVEKRVLVDGEDLVDAQPSISAQTGRPIVDFRFDISGERSFGQATSENIGRRFAIVLDGKVISAPKILGPIMGGAGEIFGNFTLEQANNLAILLRTGALPAKLVVIEERTLGPGGASRQRLHRAIIGLD